MKQQKIVLASSSPYRAQILRAAGIHDFTIRTADVEEEKFLAPDSANQALMRARAKAESVAALFSNDHLIIGADQVLEFEGQSLGKVSHRAIAADRLLQMSGKTHYLQNGLSLWQGRGEEVWSNIISVPMTMRPLTRAEVEKYLDLEPEWQKTVGSYAFEGLGAHLFERVGGDQSSIVGLPILPLLAALREQGWNLLIESNLSAKC